MSGTAGGGALKATLEKPAKIAADNTVNLFMIILQQKINVYAIFIMLSDIAVAESMITTATIEFPTQLVLLIPPRQ